MSSAQPSVVAMAPWQRDFVEKLNELALAVMNATGRQGVAAVVLTSEVGLSFGLAPGEEAKVHTAGGYVTVRSKP